jgi:succinyl-CoA synthetase beta subunit
VTVDLLEHQGKHLLRSVGISTPAGEVVTTSEGAREVADRLGGPVVLKAQVPTGKRGKAGLVRLTSTPAETEEVAGELLQATVSGRRVDTLLVEEAVDIGSELYVGVLADAAAATPVLLLSSAGGVDVEETHALRPDAVLRLPVDIRTGPDRTAVARLVERSGIAEGSRAALVDVLLAAYRLYRESDATLVEINPVALTGDGSVVALDAKVSLDPASLSRQASLVEALPGGTAQPSGTPLEQRGKQLGLHYLELDGEVGVLANGAGLTMTTLDVVHHLGGRPANFLEIGGDAYTKATPALGLVLANPRVRSLVVNFCGAFARTDVMAAGVLDAIDALQPRIPISFTIHGTGEEEAVQLVRDRLGVEPYDLMDDAVRAAVEAARGAEGEVPA